MNTSTDSENNISCGVLVRVKQTHKYLQMVPDTADAPAYKGPTEIEQKSPKI